jgi:hypothetical protein
MTEHQEDANWNAAMNASGLASQRPDWTPEERQRMIEDHQIVGESHGEPLPAGRVGVRVRVQLSGCPSGRWSTVLSANLYKQLLGHAAVGHLRLDEIVQGDEIVLDGVEESEAPTLAGTLQRAVDDTNKACTRETDPTANVAQEDADAIARQVDLVPETS